MAIRELTFESFNGRDQIKGWLYTPITQPRAVIQLVHGFGEHSRRYMHMIYTMLDSGFIVCADDHVAHGKTAFDANTWGDPGDKGFMTTIEDEHTLRALVSKEYPGLPYIMFGHSWGSMIARGYSAVYGQGLAAVVYCGTVAGMSGIDALSEALKKEIAAGRAAEDGSAFMGQMFAGMTDRYENPAGPNDWIAKDAAVVADHAADPFNNFAGVSIQLMHDFVSLYEFIDAPDWAAKVPDIPIYIIAGDQDPVGNFGEGIYAVSNRLWNSGHKSVTTKVYSGYRHEIHNEPPIRGEVERGIIEFIESAL